ncbi:MAG: hypothetical protein AMXMBFR13_30620 [Phycisphaerae bacterium]
MSDRPTTPGDRTIHVCNAITRLSTLLVALGLVLMLARGCRADAGPADPPAGPGCTAQLYGSFLPWAQCGLAHGARSEIFVSLRGGGIEVEAGKRPAGMCTEAISG